MGMEGALSENFNVSTGLRHGCVMSRWLFRIYEYMDGCVRKMKRMGSLGAGLKLNGVIWSLVASLSGCCGLR